MHFREIIGWIVEDWRPQESVASENDSGTGDRKNFEVEVIGCLGPGSSVRAASGAWVTGSLGDGHVDQLGSLLRSRQVKSELRVGSSMKMTSPHP